MTHGMFIAGDWGTTQLRLALCDSKGILARLSGPGVGALNGQTAEAVFLSLTANWRAHAGSIPTYLCGMVGSRNGWVETAYAPCPGAPRVLRDAATSFVSANCPIHIVPGLSCINPLDAPDVMRGEETQIVGAIAQHPQLTRGRHLLGMPGTHTKWAILEDGEHQRFLTVPTGELFALLREHSTLTRAGKGLDLGQEDGFAKGLDRLQTLSDHGAFLAVLFETRSRQLIEGLSPQEAVGFLSALIIGSDCATAVRQFGPVDAVSLVGDPTLTRLYGRALARHGINCANLDGSDCAFHGLREIFALEQKK